MERLIALMIISTFLGEIIHKTLTESNIINKIIETEEESGGEGWRMYHIQNIQS